MKKKTKAQGFLYNHNLRMHKNLWKVYSFALLISFLVVGIKGLI